ncbi:MAG: hypothetical protein L6R36_008154 [Xanthoria steineri]|nr:MAG: hypothetical protein L6R36_008154 [Xanthoria steineri]
MQTRRKVAITIIFLLGSFATIGSVVRIPLLVKLNVNDTPYTTVSPGIWLNVELSIGILSASLPSMRPLCSRAIPSQIRSQVRSLFSHSRHSGTHRLDDVEGVNSGATSGARAPHSKALSDSGIYQGQNKQQPHKSWYNAGAHVSSKKTGRHSEEGSEEDMVPMGRIHVKHDLEWEQERGPRSASQSRGTPETLG